MLDSIAAQLKDALRHDLSISLPPIHLQLNRSISIQPLLAIFLSAKPQSPPTMKRGADPKHGCTISKPESEHTKPAWFTVAGSFLVYFVSFGYMNSFGYFQDYYIQNDLAEFSPSIISLIGSMQLGLMLLVGPVSGTLFDAYGIKWLYLVAATGSIVSCIGLSFAQPGQIWQYFLSQVS